MLHTEVQGNGAELVLLHGWGMHGGVWREWLGYLKDWFRVTAVDLPGHGYSPYEHQCELHEWAAAVLDVAPPHAFWTGWSLGGLVALAAAAKAPERFAGLALLATTPRFVRSDDWAPAVPGDVFDQFARQLEADANRTLSRFLSLQVRGANGANQTLRRLRTDLSGRPAASPAALRAGLHLLQTSDLRNVLRELGLPVRWLLGERDTLVPAQVAGEFPGIRTTVIAGAGHAPFLSHPLQCAACLRQFLSDAGGVRHAAG